MHAPSSPRSFAAPRRIPDLVANYDLFLFDFDGTLVDTDEIYYKSFKRAFEEKGLKFNMSFEEFTIQLCSTKLIWQELDSVNHLSDDLVEELRYLRSVYYWDSIQNNEVKLKPGVEDLLHAIRNAGKACYVCTRSSEKEVDAIKSFLPALEIIPTENWLTRHMYTSHKPNPECYLMAISQHTKQLREGLEIDLAGSTSPRGHKGEEGDGALLNVEDEERACDIEMGKLVSKLRVVGFEDTPTGINTLLATQIVQPVLVSTVKYLEADFFAQHGVIWSTGFDDMTLPHPQPISVPATEPAVRRTPSRKRSGSKSLRASRELLFPDMTATKIYITEPQQ